MLNGMNKNDTPKENPETESEEMSQGFQSRVQETAQDLKERAQEWQRRAAEAARNATRLTDNYVHENPWPVIISVAASCFLLGFLAGHRRD